MDIREQTSDRNIKVVWNICLRKARLYKQKNISIHKQFLKLVDVNLLLNLLIIKIEEG